MRLNNLNIVLDSINWNFNNRKKYSNKTIHPVNCRRYFSYPATFIPEIPFTLVEILSKEGDLVMDPFGGIGTTFLQAIIQKRRAISIDNNSIASAVNKDFFNLIKPDIDLENCMEKLFGFCSEYDETKDYTIDIEGKRKNLEDWYESHTFNEIAFLINQYDKRKDNITIYEKSLFHICLSNILTTVSSQNGGWAYFADNVKPKQNKLVYKSAIDRFKFCMKQIVKDFMNYKDILGDSFDDFYCRYKNENHIIAADLINMRDLPERGNVDLIITSPPYPKMIDYVKSQRLSFCFEEKSYEEELEKEIGARCYRNNKGNISKYIDDMHHCNDKMFDMLKKGGYLCYILPGFLEEDSGERRNAIEKVIEDCIDNGFKCIYETVRCIPGTQRSNNIKWASLKRERILVLEKE